MFKKKPKSYKQDVVAMVGGAPIYLMFTSETALRSFRLYEAGNSRYDSLREYKGQDGSTIYLRPSQVAALVIG